MKDLLEFLLGDGITDYWWVFIVLAIVLYAYYTYWHTHAGPHTEPEYAKTMSFCRKFFYVYTNIFAIGIIQCIPAFWVGVEHSLPVNIILGIVYLFCIVVIYYSILVAVTLVTVFSEFAVFTTSPFDDYVCQALDPKK